MAYSPAYCRAVSAAREDVMIDGSTSTRSYAAKKGDTPSEVESLLKAELDRNSNRSARPATEASYRPDPR